MNNKHIPKLSNDNLTIEFDLNDFKKSLPHLSSELENKKNQIKIDGVENSIPDPGAIDFIRRCNTKEEAYEIIDFLLKQNEIQFEEYIKLKNQIADQGLLSFGPKKTYGHYERKYRRKLIP